MKKFLFLTLAFLTVMLWGCKKEKENTKTEQTKDTVAVSEDTVKQFYLVPAPKDIFGFSEDKNLTFHKELLNPPENLDKYTDTKLQEFNFGVYSADLAYSAAYNKKDETAIYLDLIKKLSDKIGLSEIFNEQLINRIQNVAPVKDSLIDLSTDVYFSIIHYLERNQRENSIAIMAAGGWLETIYLVINQITYSKDNPSIQKLADQKYILDNLMNFLNQYKSNPNVAAIYEEFKPIQQIYNQLQTVEIQQKQISDADKIVVGGNKQLVMTENQFEQLKNTINNIRNKLTLNSSK